MLQMAIQGKRDGFTVTDLEACGKVGMLKRNRVRYLIDQVQASVKKWPEFSKRAEVETKTIKERGSHHRGL